MWTQNVHAATKNMHPYLEIVRLTEALRSRQLGMRLSRCYDGPNCESCKCHGWRWGEGKQKQISSWKTIYNDN